MTQTPLVLYLDTQDYINLFNEPDDGPNHAILEQLMDHKNRGEIVIGYSWVIMLEFITRPTEKFREERVRRGQLVKNICGPNAFPFFGDIQNGARFPNEGVWISGWKGGKSITAKWFRKEMQTIFLEELRKHNGLSRVDRRRLKKPQALAQLFRENKMTWGEKREDYKGFPVSDEIVESGILDRFMKGQCSDAEFEDRMNRWLNDPAEYSRIVYDYADMPNMIAEFFGDGIDKFEAAFHQFQDSHQVFECLREGTRGIRQNLIELGVDKSKAKKITKPVKRAIVNPIEIVKKLEQTLGVGRAEHFGHYIAEITKPGYSFKRSDLMDIMQMCNVSECDLFRCDKAMANIFRGFAPFEGKLVGLFTELPQRIEILLAQRRAK